MEKLSQFCFVLIFLSKQYSCDRKCSAQEFECGDVCIARTNVCYCGTDDPSFDPPTIVMYSSDYENGQRCWVTPGTDTCYQDDGQGFCVNGIKDAIKLCGDIEILSFQSCDGNCSDWRFELGFFGCATTGDNCVNPTEMCHGYSQCNDKSDLKFCNNRQCQILSDDSTDLSQCEKDLKLPTEHSECYNPTREKENGRFNCLGRQDENITLAWKEAEEMVKYEDLNLCANSTGIQCGSECVDMYDWCEGVTNSGSCPIINSPQLCSNYTFWQDKDCGKVARRCTGKSQQCFGPDYSNVKTNGGDFEIKSYCVNNFKALGHTITTTRKLNLRAYCPDNSHLVFPMNTACSDIYADIICDGMYKQTQHFDDEILQICMNRTIPCTDDDSLDQIPEYYYCEQSCEARGPNCQACTNPDYFNCTRSKQCVHTSLVCDGHPQCEAAEDEDLDICYDKLVEQGDIKATATLLCSSIMYPNMTTMATACDGIVECDGEVDENWICNSKNIFSYGVLVFCFLILCFVFASKWSRQKKFKYEVVNTNPLLPIQLDEVFKSHGEQNFRSSITAILKRTKLLDPQDTRIQINQQYYNLELEVHGGDIANTKCCIKNYLDPSIFTSVLEDIEPGFIRNFTPWLETFLENIDENKWIRWLFRKVKEIATIYIDLFKDSLLVFSIILAIGGISSLVYFPTKLTSVVVFCFLSSILFPLLMSSLLLAEETMDESTKSTSQKEKICIFMKSILLSFLHPMILIDQYETHKEKLDEAVGTIRDENDMEEVLKLQQEAQSLKAKYVDFVRIDLQLETMFQTAGQILLLLLTITKTPATGGLEKIFEETSISYLIISIGWSVKTCFMQFFKSKTLEKPFMQFSSKMLVLLWAMCVAMKRILVLVFFFVPSFGLLDLLYHWKYEQTPFAVSESGKMSQKSILYLHNSNPLPWAQLDRWIYADPEYNEWLYNEFVQFKTKIPPPYTLYTGLSLGQYFILFWIILAVHTIVIAFAKWFMSENYRTASYLKMCVHALENVNFPYAFLDWDTPHGSIREHKDRLQKVTKEVSAVIAVNFIFNLLLLVPLFYTVANIWERHELLRRTIGTKEEENISNENATFWLTAVTFLYFLLSIMELCLYLLYNYKAHPWKDIIQESKDANMRPPTAKGGKMNPEIEISANNREQPREPEANQLYVLNIRIYQKTKDNDYVNEHNT